MRVSEKNSVRRVTKISNKNKEKSSAAIKKVDETGHDDTFQPSTCTSADPIEPLPGSPTGPWARRRLNAKRRVVHFKRSLSHPLAEHPLFPRFLASFRPRYKLARVHAVRIHSTIDSTVVPDESTTRDRLYAQPCREPCCAAAAGRERREIDEAREQTLATVRKRFAIERVEEVGVRHVLLADSVAEDLHRLPMRGRIAARLGQRKLNVAHKCNVGF